MEDKYKKLIYMNVTINLFNKKGIRLVIPETKLIINKEGYILITDHN